MPKRPAPRRQPPRSRKNAPHGGSPAGLLLIVVGGLGMLYAACGPREKARPMVGEPRATVAAAPRRRYVPPKPTPAPMPVPASQPAERGDTETDLERREREDARATAQREEPKPVEVVETPVTLQPEPASAPEKSRDLEPAPAPRTARSNAPRPAPTPRERAVVSREWARNPGATNAVALTFDGCYVDKPLPKILAALQDHGYQATFFLAGKFVQRYPESVRRISDAGMELGNHSWSHPAFTKLSDTEIRSQLKQTNDLIEKTCGVRPNLFRPPFGARDDRVRRLVANNGYHTVYWALDSWDAVKKDVTPAFIKKRVLDRVKPGDVVLMHIGSEATADALPGLLDALEERGLKVVPVTELMN